MAELQRAEARLVALRDSLGGREGGPWTFDGVCLDTYPSGQAFITAYVEDNDVCFWLELRPLGAEGWEVDGRVLLADREGSLDAAELTERRYASPREACIGFAAASAELSELALSRPALASAWPVS